VCSYHVALFIGNQLHFHFDVFVLIEQIDLFNVNVFLIAITTEWWYTFIVRLLIRVVQKKTILH